MCPLPARLVQGQRLPQACLGAQGCRVQIRLACLRSGHTWAAHHATTPVLHVHHKPPIIFTLLRSCGRSPASQHHIESAHVPEAFLHPAFLPSLQWPIQRPLAAHRQSHRGNDAAQPYAFVVPLCDLWLLPLCSIPVLPSLPKCPSFAPFVNRCDGTISPPPYPWWPLAHRRHNMTRPSLPRWPGCGIVVGSLAPPPSALRRAWPGVHGTGSGCFSLVSLRPPPVPPPGPGPLRRIASPIDTHHALPSVTIVVYHRLSPPHNESVENGSYLGCSGAYPGLKVGCCPQNHYVSTGFFHTSRCESGCCNCPQATERNPQSAHEDPAQPGGGCSLSEQVA